MKRRHTLSTFALAISFALGAAQCGDITTGRERVSFDVFARGGALEGTTSMGWTVRIEAAAAALGPVRWYEGEALFGRTRTWSLGVAHAHPGHYVPGGALADVTQRVVIDLTAPQPMFMARAEGVSGEARSAHLEVRTSSEDLGPARSLLHGGAVYVRGVATRGTNTVRFEASAPLDVNIEGIPARATLDGSPGHWVLTVDVLRWIDRVDFSELPAPASPGATVAFPSTGQPANALFRGATTGASYRFTWQHSPRDAGR
jgi:hypothetical protein